MLEMAKAFKSPGPFDRANIEIITEESVLN